MASRGSRKRWSFLRSHQWPVIDLIVASLLEEFLHSHAGGRTGTYASAGSFDGLCQEPPIPQHLGQQQEQRQEE